MSIYWDIDGVLRDLDTFVYGFHAPYWDYEPNGKDIFELIKEYPETLIRAEQTEYVSIYNRCKNSLLLSCQPEDWRPLTSQWIIENLLTCHVIFTKCGEEKLKYLKDGDYLVEDSPKLSDYSKIILIDRPYNRDIKAFCRVYNPVELERVMKGMRVL